MASGWEHRNVPASPGRDAAFRVLLRVETQDSYSTELLHSKLLDRLSAADRALATELVMGTLRWQSRLDDALEAAGRKSIRKFDPEVKTALRLGAYQLLFLDRVPARAAVNESVELIKAHGKRSAAPLVNAFLRRVSRDFTEEQVFSDAIGLARKYAHPEWLVERWVKSYGLATTQAICDYDQQRPPATIRAPGRAEQRASILAELASEQIAVEAGQIVTGALHLISGDLTHIAAYRERRLTIQDEGSQLVGLLASGRTILDCCAAPGGKTSIARERNPHAIIVSMDLHLHRARLMRDLIASRLVVAGDARRTPFAGRFDCVIADLPCTGTGTLARNPEIKWRLMPHQLAELSSLQLDILTSVAMIGKAIVFSTCSLEPEEGEDVVAHFLARNSDFRLKPAVERLQELVSEGAITESAVQSIVRGQFLRTIPGIHSCDGFFAAILERS
jgi:16S rRNA (cytosine967-C5)-methyltransferase